MLPNEVTDGFKALPWENQILMLKKVEAPKQELLALAEPSQPKSTFEGLLLPQELSIPNISNLSEPSVRMNACKGRIPPQKKRTHAEPPLELVLLPDISSTYTPVGLLSSTSPPSIGAQFVGAAQGLQDDQSGHGSRGSNKSSQSSAPPQLHNIKETRQSKEPLAPLQTSHPTSKSINVSVDIHDCMKLSGCPMNPQVLLEPLATPAVDNLSGVDLHADSLPLNLMVCAPLLSAN